MAWQFWKRKKERIEKQASAGIPVLLVSSPWQLESAVDTWKETAYYQNHQLIYACVKALAEDIAALPILVYDEKGNSLEFEAFRRPHRLISFYELMRDTVAYLLMSGNAFWHVLIYPSTGRFKMINLFPPGLMKVKKLDNSEEPRLQYIYVRGDNTEQKYEDTEIFHFKTFNPDNRLVGMSVIRALRKAVSLNWRTMLLIEELLKYDSTPPAVLESEQALTKEMADEVRQMWEESQKKRGRIAVLPYGLKFRAVNLNPKDIEFLNTYKLTREDILMAFGVPPVRVGLLEHASYANAYQQMELYVNNTLRALAALISNTIETNYYQATGRVIKVHFDFSQHPVYIEGLMRKIQSATQLFRMGVPWNVIRARLLPEFPELPWGAYGYLPGNLLPTGKYEDSKKFFVRSKQYYSNLWVTDKIAEKAYFLRIHQKYEEDIRPQVYRRLLKDVDFLVPRVGKLLKGEKAFEDHIVWEVLGLDDLIKIWTDLYEDFLTTVMTEEAQREITRGKLKIEFALPTRFVKDVAHLWGLQTTETTKNMIIDIIYQGMNEGASINEIQRRIKEKLTDFSWARSLRIARTTVTRGMNSARNEIYKQAGIEYKEWLTALDEVVRETHQELEGQIVSVWEKFVIPSTGASAEAPGLFHIASEDINCRCSIAPVEKK